MSSIVEHTKQQSYRHTSQLFKSLPWYTEILLESDQRIKDFGEKEHPEFKVRPFSDSTRDIFFSSFLLKRHLFLGFWNSNERQCQAYPTNSPKSLRTGSVD